MKPISTQILGQIANSLAKQGFARSQGNCYVLDNIRFVLDQSWPVLERTDVLERAVDPLQEDWCQAGLWKCVTDDGIPKRRFDLPPALLQMPRHYADEAETGALPFEAILAWAVETAKAGAVPLNWRAPSLEEIGLAKRDLVLQQGPFVRRGRIVREDHFLALRFSVLNRPRTGLGASRRRWLRQIVLDAQNRWRIVRFRLDSIQASVEAEVNLSGTPLPLMDCLLQVALAALQGSVKWLVGSVELLADTKLESKFLELWEM